MTNARRGPRVLLSATAAAVVAALAASAPAAALGPPDLRAAPASPSNAQTFTFTFAATPDVGAQIVRYEGGFGDAAAEIASPVVTPPPGAADGRYEFRVRAVETNPLAPDEVITGPFRTVAITVDRTPPAPPRASFPQADGENGWYRTLTVRWSCSDPSGASCPATTFTAAGRAQYARQVARDGAGNVSAEAVAGPFNFDNGAALAAPSTPSPGAILTEEPTYVWRNGNDPTSGHARTEVWARWTGVSDQLIARVNAPERRSARNVRSAPLPIRTQIRWFVRFYDRAGNHNDSAARTFTIEPTPPSAAPVVTGGPDGPTNARAPEFSWTGDAPRYVWTLTPDGAEEPSQRGDGPERRAAVQPLADGDYTFSVAQVTALGAEGPEATRSFSVDTVAPPAPVVTLRPPAATTAPAEFAWTTEPGAFSRWTVLDSGGRQVRAPMETPAARATIAALGAGGYTFHLQQIDPAGNASPPVDEAFSVGGPATPAPARARATALPALNARRLKPRRGARLLTVRPTLRWRKGPASTALYNVQMFRVVRAGRSQRLVKVLSAFPKGTVLVVPRSVTKAGSCYVWRVWPYTRSKRFTAKPLGISNFCIASKAAIRKARAAQNKARKAKRRAQPAKRARARGHGAVVTVVTGDPPPAGTAAAR
jgi:hypothetical protein